MVKQRFRVLFRRWFFTVMRFCGPILVYELFALVRQHFQYAPLGMSVLLMGAFLAFLLTALRVLAVGTGTVGMIQAAEVTRLRERAAGNAKEATGSRRQSGLTRRSKRQLVAGKLLPGRNHWVLFLARAAKRLARAASRGCPCPTP